MKIFALWQQSQNFFLMVTRLKLLLKISKIFFFWTHLDTFFCHNCHKYLSWEILEKHLIYIQCANTNIFPYLFKISRALYYRFILIREKWKKLIIAFIQYESWAQWQIREEWLCLRSSSTKRWTSSISSISVSSVTNSPN